MTLKDARRKAGMTQQQLAQRAGVSLSTVFFIEQGRLKRAPNYTTVQALAQALGMGVDQIEFTRKEATK